MADAKLFEAAFGIEAPWFVRDVAFYAKGRTLTIAVDFKPRTRFAAPGVPGEHPVHDMTVKRYWHLNLFQHERFLKVRVPRVKGSDGSVRQGEPTFAVGLQAALEAVQEATPRVIHDHGGEFVNGDVAAVIKARNLIEIKTKPRHPESNGIVERFKGTVRAESDDDYGQNYLQAEAIIVKLIHHYNEARLHATLGYMTPADLAPGAA